MADYSEPETGLCRRCGEPLAGDELAGNCPRCLVTALLSPDAPEPAGMPTTPVLRRLGDYELIEEVARGGMGVVFRARQISLGREVAVKVLRDAWLATPVQVKRFRAEAANAAKLKHPNIVSVHDFGEQDGQHYFTMDLVSGANLAEVTRPGPLPPRRAAEVVVKVAAAVQHAHEQGVLHRDLKPSNVLLDSQDEPQVTDFGLARPLEEESSLTLTGQVLGTPGYIAPEQAKGGGAVGPAADVYGLGALLYHLLTGRAPFVGASAAETLTQVLQQEPLSPRLLNPVVPTDLAAVCLRCLRKLPRERYDRAGRLAEDLRRFLEGQPTLAQPAGLLEGSVRWCRRKPALVATGLALILVGAIGLVGILLEWRRAEAESLKFQFRSYVADMDLASRALDEGDLGTAQALVRRYWPGPHEHDLRNWEWRYLANLSEGDPHFSLVRHSASVLSLRFVTDDTLLTCGTADFYSVLWNLKERRPSSIITNLHRSGGISDLAAVAHKRNALYYRAAWNASTGVMIVDLQSGKQSKLLEATGVVRSLDLSPDEKVLAVAFANRVGLWDLARKTWLNPFETESGAAMQGLFSPDGRVMVVADEFGHVAFWNLAQRTKHVLTNAAGSLGVLRFSADGRWLVNPGGASATRVWNVEDRSLVAELPDSASVERAAFSPDGRWLATVGGDPSVRLWETSRWQKTRTLRGHTDPITAAEFSPNGHFLATSSRNGEVKLWSMDAPRTALEPVSFPPSAAVKLAADGSGFSRIAGPAWTNGVASWTAEVWTTSPLQRTLTVPLPAGPPSSGAILAGSRAVVLGGSDGSVRVVGPGLGTEIVLTNAHNHEVYLMDASLDGSTLATKGLWKEPVRIWRLPYLERIAELPRAENVHGVKLSDDGRWLAFFTGPGDVGVWEIPAMKGPPMWHGVPAAQTLTACAFSPDNRWLAAAVWDGGAFLWDLRTHRPMMLPRAMTRYISFSFSPDGSRLAAGSEGESKLFDVATAQAVLSFKQHGLQLAFTRDGERLLAVHSEGASVLAAPSFEKLQFGWLKEKPSQEVPPYLGPEPNYARPDRP